MRVLCHAQHLSGVGHYVRMRAIARGLAGAHEVHVVEAGLPMPLSHGDSKLHRLSLPPLTRVKGEIVAVAGGIDPEAVLAQRAALLADATRDLRPDVVLIDHYPFSKWELEAEMEAVIAAARSVNPRARVVCSLRDVAPQTRHERVDRGDYERRVLATLGARFDAVLVHSDPVFTRLDEHFGRSAEIPVPVLYTGFVAGETPAAATTPAHAVLSCGGGAWNLPFLLNAVEAFRQIGVEATVGMPLLVFAAAFSTEDDLAALRRAAAGCPFRVRRFADDFECALSGCDLSISRAGYNTCVALLRSCRRAVLVPDPIMSDQAFRAARLEELGLATCVAGDGDVAAIAAAIRQALARPIPQHQLDLGGVARTRSLLEALVSQPLLQ